MKFNSKESKLSKENTSYKNKKYWKSLDEVADTPEFHEWLEKEFPEGATSMEGIDRRHFLKIMAASFTFAGLGLSGCRQPEQHLLPYSKQPERIVPGVPIFYASSMPDAYGNIPLIVETHDARPTKIEGNPSYSTYGGSTNAFAQASILDLYDQDRAQKSVNKDKSTVSKAKVLDLLKNTYEEYKSSKGKGLAFLAEKSTSPSRARLVKLLKERLPEATWAEYEAINYDKIEESLTELLSQATKPHYNFRNAKRVLTIDSNIFQNEPGSLGYVRDFAEARRVKNTADASKMNRLYSVESDFTNTGGMADHRLRLSTSQMEAFTALLASEVFDLTSGNGMIVSLLKEKGTGLDIDQKWIKECAKDLVENEGNALVVGGGHLSDKVHGLVFAINEQLKARGSTVTYKDLGDKEPALGINDLAEKIKADEISSLVILGGNPVYNAPGDLNWSKLQAKVGQVIRYGYHFDETSEFSDVHIAANHYLESWNDGRTYEGTYVPVQPMILPLFEGFSELEVLGYLVGESKPEGYSIVKDTFDSLTKGQTFDEWLAIGVLNGSEYKDLENIKINPQTLLDKLNNAKIETPKLSKDNLEFRFKPSNQVYDGRYNNNGWLQEFPEPMTKLTWDNAVIISPKLAEELQNETGFPILPPLSMMNKEGQAHRNANTFKRGKEESYIVELTLNNTRIKGPLHIQPGLADYTVILPLGYGRKTVGRVGQGTGFDVYPLVNDKNPTFVVGGSIRVTYDKQKLANTQEHWSMEGRAIIREATAKEYVDNPNFADQIGSESHSPPVYGSAKDMPLEHKVTEVPRGASAYKTPPFTAEQQWGMSIDLNTCTGCSACVIACQSENNVAIVGKDQVLRGREMHWIRLDRYYSTASDSMTKIPEDPQVSFMSVLCQHCELAPCENVCPVNATVHDSEGLNLMVYNRCVGTRYCANNCPYKVRRFNFFDWNKRHIGHFYEGPLGPAGMPQLHQMQKNPDVTVRMRGVMEKCTFCLQRIEEAKIDQRVEAKDSNNTKVPDGTIKTACQQVCPTDSIVFGDVADPNSEVYKLKQLDRDYALLGYLNTRPRLTFLAKLRNPNPLMPDSYKEPFSREEYEKRYGHSAFGEHDEVKEEVEA